MSRRLNTEELVERLRICPDYNDGCKNCPYEHDLGCRSTTMREAADAIEELTAYASLYENLTDKGQKVARKLIDAYPKWISVEERLPEKGVVVLAFGTRSATTGQFQGVGTAPWFWWWKGHTIKRVTHWMPMPEPPKEDADA